MGQLLAFPQAPAISAWVPPVQGSLALEWSSLPEVPQHSVPSLRLAEEPPALRPIAARLLQGLLDVDAGLRPAHQVMGWTTPAVYRSLLRREQRTRSIAAAGQGRIRPTVRITSIRVQEVHTFDDTNLPTAEISAVLLRTDSRGTRRMAAAAVRMEANDGHWRATAFEV